MMNLKRIEAKKKSKATEIDSFANNILFVNLPSLWTDHYGPWVD